MKSFCQTIPSRVLFGFLGLNVVLMGIQCFIYEGAWFNNAFSLVNFPGALMLGVFEELFHINTSYAFEIIFMVLSAAILWSALAVIILFIRKRW